MLSYISAKWNLQYICLCNPFHFSLRSFNVCFAFVIFLRTSRPVVLYLYFIVTEVTSFSLWQSIKLYLQIYYPVVFLYIAQMPNKCIYYYYYICPIHIQHESWKYPVNVLRKEYPKINKTHSYSICWILWKIVFQWYIFFPFRRCFGISIRIRFQFCYGFVEWFIQHFCTLGKNEAWIISNKTICSDWWKMYTNSSLIK